MAISTPSRQTHMRDDNYWETGRLVAHVIGDQAGNLRLDIDIDEFGTPEEVAEHVQLVIPGETYPLDAKAAVGKNGRFVISYFSSGIANAGPVPAEAVVRWDVNGNENRMKSVKVVSAKEVKSEQGEEAVNVPAVAAHTANPKAVSLLVIGGLAVALAVTIAFLMQS